MKGISKIMFGLTLTLVLAVLLTGCGNKENSDDFSKNAQTKDNNLKNGDSKEPSTVDDMKLYSDDTKIVFNMQDVYYLVYYHNGHEITGLEYIYDYQDSAAAKSAAAVLKTTQDENIEKIEAIGSKVKVVFKKEQYKGETLESVRQTYSYLEEIKK